MRNVLTVLVGVRPPFLRMSCDPRDLLCILAASIAVGSHPALPAEVDCGDPFYNGDSGPYDYNDSEVRPTKIRTIERNHFTRQVESLIQGQSQFDPAGDIDFTLRAVPNHHRALYAISKYELQRGRIDRRWRSADCYFDRAMRFRPNDPVVYMLHGLHHAMRDKHKKALESYEIAKQKMPASVELHYNIALSLIALGEYDEARESAKFAYDGGFPLPGLRRKLERLGYGW